MSQEHAGPATHSQMSTKGQLRINSKLVNSKQIDINLNYNVSFFITYIFPLVTNMITNKNKLLTEISNIWNSYCTKNKLKKDSTDLSKRRWSATEE